MSDQDIVQPDHTGADKDSTAQPIRIILADDHRVVRSGLQLLLDSEQDFEVVAEASNIEDARR
jgi:hypothetical protein